MRLELEGECNFATSWRTQHDFGRIVNIRPLCVSLVKEVPSAGGDRHSLRQMVSTVNIHGPVAQEFREVSVVGKSFAYESQTSTEFERYAFYLPDMHPQICARGRQVSRLRSCVVVPGGDVLEAPKSRVRIRRVEVDVEIVERMK